MKETKISSPIVGGHTREIQKAAVMMGIQENYASRMHAKSIVRCPTGSDKRMPIRNARP